MSKNKINLQLFGCAEDDAVEILRDINKEYSHLNADQQIELAKLAQLKRIADNLGDIYEILDRLDCCLGVSSSGGYLRVHNSGAVEITGTIDQY